MEGAFFKNAMKPEWSRGNEPIDLTDEDPAIVEVYIKWLYSDNLAVNVAEGETAANDDTRKLRLYVLGEKLMHKAFQDAVLRVFVHGCRARRMYPTGHMISLLYDGTTAASPTRRLVVDMYCWRGAANWADNNFNNAHPDLMRDCMRALMKIRKVPKGEPSWETDLTQYCLGGKSVEIDTASDKVG
jgi:hypothetical protein